MAVRKGLLMFTVICMIAACLALAAGCGGGDKGEAPSGTTGTETGDSAQLASCRANLRTIDSAVSQYRAANGKDPRGLQELVPTYLRSIPREPMGGSYSISGGKAVCSEGHSY